MKTINMHEAKTHLSRLVEEAMKGETFIIAKAGKPMVKVLPIDTPPEGKERRLGSLKGMYQITDDVKEPFRREVEEMFFGKSETKD